MTWWHRVKTDLRPLLKHLVDLLSETSGSSKLSKDLPEELLWVNTGLLRPVVLLLALSRMALAQTRRPVRVVPLPFHFVAEHLDRETRTEPD